MRTVPSKAERKVQNMYNKYIELYHDGEIDYKEALRQMKRHYEVCTRTCPWNNSVEELTKFRRAKGLLEELRFIKQYKD